MLWTSISKSCFNANLPKFLIFWKCPSLNTGSTPYSILDYIVDTPPVVTVSPATPKYASISINYVVTWNVKTYVSHPLKCRMSQNWLKWCSDTPPSPLNPTWLFGLRKKFFLSKFEVVVGGGLSDTRHEIDKSTKKIFFTVWLIWT